MAREKKINCKCIQTFAVRKNHEEIGRKCDNCGKIIYNNKRQSLPKENTKKQKESMSKSFLDENGIENEISTKSNIEEV